MGGCGPRRVTYNSDGIRTSRKPGARHDLEDAVIHEAARLAGMRGIVTPNAVDFAGAELPIFTPTELQTILDALPDDAA